MKLHFRDIRDKFQYIRVIHKEILFISRSRLSTKHFKEIVQAVKEGYFGNEPGKVKQASQAYSKEHTVYEHSMDSISHGGKIKRSMSFGIVSD